MMQKDKEKAIKKKLEDPFFPGSTTIEDPKVKEGTTVYFMEDLKYESSYLGPYFVPVTILRISPERAMAHTDKQPYKIITRYDSFYLTMTEEMQDVQQKAMALQKMLVNIDRLSELVKKNKDKVYMLTENQVDDVNLCVKNAMDMIRSVAKLP